MKGKYTSCQPWLESIVVTQGLRHGEAWITWCAPSDDENACGDIDGFAKYNKTTFFLQPPSSSTKAWSTQQRSCPWGDTDLWPLQHSTYYTYLTMICRMFWGKKLKSICALTTDINRRHHRSQQYLKRIKDVASDACERIQFNDLASLGIAS